MPLDRLHPAAEQRLADAGRRVREDDGIGRAHDPDDAPPECDARGEAARGVDLGQLGHGGRLGLHDLEQLDLEHESRARLDLGRRAAVAVREIRGQTSRLLPPTFMSWTPSVQHLMTPFSGNVAG